jgi:hypothetical protein
MLVLKKYTSYLLTQLNTKSDKYSKLYRTSCVLAQKGNKSSVTTKELNLNKNNNNQTLCTMAKERLCKSHGQGVTAAVVLVAKLHSTKN